MKNFDSELLDEIKKRFSTKEDMASTLSEWLSTNKNAIYRRLRGDTLFTFNELCMIASKLEISIDKIVLKENSVICSHQLYDEQNNSFDFFLVNTLNTFQSLSHQSNASNSRFKELTLCNLIIVTII